MDVARESEPGAQQDSLEERIRGLEEAQRATRNMLDDFDAHKAKLEDAQKAVFNILEDFREEKLILEGTHAATLNVLEDFDQEKRGLEAGLTATFNILEDFSEEKLRLEQIQRATFNLLEDLNEEKSKVEAASEELEHKITQLKLAEEEIRKLNQELEQRVIERTAQLDAASKGLAERAEQLTRSNAELQQFAYVASHDLQEPLRTVASFVQLLARKYKGKLDDEADEYINFAVDGSTRMQTLINDLLTLSRVGTSGRPFAPTNCKSVLEQTLANLMAAIEESGAVITQGPLPVVMADGAQLVQVFQNLIGNAIKFRAGQAPRVHVSVERSVDSWTFSVRDNGIGIDQKYFGRLFMVFQRLHGRTEYPGTGIGLAICKKIVERHGGRIWVESEPGRGSVFKFTIPNRRGVAT